MYPSPPCTTFSTRCEAGCAIPAQHCPCDAQSLCGCTGCSTTAAATGPSQDGSRTGSKSERTLCNPTNSPESSRASDLCRICRAMFTTSSKLMLPLCLTVTESNSTSECVNTRVFQPLCFIREAPKTLQPQDSCIQCRPVPSAQHKPPTRTTALCPDLVFSASSPVAALPHFQETQLCWNTNCLY